MSDFAIMNKKEKSVISSFDKNTLRTAMPFIGFLLICLIFYILTGGKIFAAANIKLLFSQTYMLMIASSGVFMVMTMGGLDFSQGSMLGVCSIVICYLSNYNIVLAILGGVAVGGLIGLVTPGLNYKAKAGDTVNIQLLEDLNVQK